MISKIRSRSTKQKRMKRNKTTTKKVFPKKTLFSYFFLYLRGHNNLPEITTNFVYKGLWNIILNDYIYNGLSSDLVFLPLKFQKADMNESLERKIRNNYITEILN